MLQNIAPALLEAPDPCTGAAGGSRTFHWCSLRLPEAPGEPSHAPGASETLHFLRIAPNCSDDSQSLREPPGARITFCLCQLRTTSRLNESQKERQSVEDVEAQILTLLTDGINVIEERNNLKQELLPTHLKLRTMEEGAPECNLGDLEEKIRNSKERLENRTPAGTESLRQELEETDEQVRICGEERNKYRDQVKRVLALGGNGGNSSRNRGHEGSEILQLLGTDMRALRGWMAQLAMKIADEPTCFFDEQSKM
ncbi:hypothetical protein BDD12DRAFT_900360 [Trichophaea hybrida]|nr:hypothetical protein BDD12DRAFT_900360 [Trichophaea hybrida]